MLHCVSNISKYITPISLCWYRFNIQILSYFFGIPKTFCVTWFERERERERERDIKRNLVYQESLFNYECSRSSI